MAKAFHWFSWKLLFLLYVLFLSTRFIILHTKYATHFTDIISAVRHRPTAQNYAYVILLCSQDAAQSAIALVHSIKQTKSPHTVVVLMRNSSEDLRPKFAALQAIVQPATFRSCLHLKISAWNLTRYDKVVVLDPRLLVLNNIDHLFTRPQLSAAPEETLPDRFDSGLMVLDPDEALFLSLSIEYDRLTPSLERVYGSSPSVENIFFNDFFHEWPRGPPEYHLDYGYNANASLAHSTAWLRYIHPHLKAIRVPDGVDTWHPPIRWYQHLKWAVLREANSILLEQNLLEATDSVFDPGCHLDFMAYSKGSLSDRGQDWKLDRQLSAVIRFHGRISALQKMLLHYSLTFVVRQLYVQPVSQSAAQTLQRSSLLKDHPGVHLLPLSPYTVSSRFRPIEAMASDCIFLTDDSATVSLASLEEAFLEWRKQPDRLVGFFPSAHSRDPGSHRLTYIPTPRGQFSMVTLRAVLLHSNYFYHYSCRLPQSVRDYVDKSPECEDIAVNVMAHTLGASPPLLILDNAKDWVPVSPLHDPHPEAIKLRVSQLSQCLNDMEAMLGSLQLAHSSVSQGFMAHNVFNKVAWREPGSLLVPSLNRTSNFEPIFNPALAADASLKFMAAIPAVPPATPIPDVTVLPAVLQPLDVVCLRGASSSIGCLAGRNCSNHYAVMSFLDAPPVGDHIPGTTLILHSKLGFQNRFQALNILANLMYPNPRHGPSISPDRILLYKRGGVVPRVEPWFRQLAQSLLGDSVEFWGGVGGPVCLERAAIVRKFNPLESERKMVLRRVQERILGRCSGGDRRVSDSRSVAGVVRILVLQKGILNFDSLSGAFRQLCANPDWSCQLVLPHTGFETPCQQATQMLSVDVLVATFEDTNLSHLCFMREGTRVLEMLPRGIPGHKVRSHDTLREGANWLGLEYHAIIEPSMERNSTIAKRRGVLANVNRTMEWVQNVIINVQHQ